MQILRLNFESLPVAQWTADEALFHISLTFNRAVDERPDLMEPYLVRLAEASTDGERKEIMRAGLRETVMLRFPMPWASK